MKSLIAKGLASLLIPIVLALTPAASIAYWVEGGSELVYSRPDYSVIYKPNIFNLITGSNETRIKIEVRDEAGRPLGFFALLSGPASENVIEVGRAEGEGYAVKGIGRYVAEVKRLLREANSDPERSGIGMLVLLSTIIEENREYYAAADAVSVPIIPGKAVGKDIIVTVKFKPIMKYKVRDVEGSEIRDRNIMGPPDKIINYYIDTGAIGVAKCFEWRFVETLYATQNYIPDYIPVAITKLNSYFLIDKTQLIQHYFEIILNRAKVTYVSFDLSLGFRNKDGTISLQVPGPGHIIEIDKEKNVETIYKINCYIFSTLVQDQRSRCEYLVADGEHKPSFASRFTGDVLFSTGFYGKLWLARYQYVFTRGGVVESVLNDNVLVVWMEPVFNDNRKIIPGWEVDDDPNDGLGYTEKMLKKLENYVEYKYSGYSYGGYSLSIYDIYIKSQASQFFGSAIAVGSLIAFFLGGGLPGEIAAILSLLSIGVNAGSVSTELYTNMGLLAIQLTDSYINYRVYAWYAKFNNTYMVKEESADKVVPLIIFWPR